MDKEQAKELIKNTFEASFNKEGFVIFIKNLLNEVDESSFKYSGNLIPDSFKQYINSYERIGKYTEGNNRIDILIVNLKEETSLKRARSMQRNFIAGYLNGKYGSNTLKDAALVAFVSPIGDEDWRFSLVKMNYRYDEQKNRIKEDFTPARRWSFLVGRNEKSHTAQSRLLPILQDDEGKPTLERLEEAFNIEPVTKEFFEEYRCLLIRTVDSLDEIVRKDEKIKKDFKTKNINTVDFAKKLLGQIVFLYFLQKKGWFGVKRDQEWGSGSKNFLRELFEQKHGNYKNFFNDILEPLFYEALRYDRSYDDHYFSYFKCKIPFLNGGLFEPINDYNWKDTHIELPDKLFSNERKTQKGDIGDGILDIFDRFNFTVKEDEPLEKEVAIDPELLGKAYEKFNAIRFDNFEEYKKALASGKKTLEKKFNKQYGVYYTPREIVHYMCQQSLINYLYTSVNDELMKQPAKLPRQGKLIGQNDPVRLRFQTDEEVVSEEDIRIFIEYGERFAENEEVALLKENSIKAGRQKATKTKFELPINIRQYARIIDEKLKDIKVCDPAVGSGAFLVGMMHEIAKARNVLSIFINDSGRTIYNFKRECIENSLYGVDIDSGACEVAKLRLWLSLVVDEEDIAQIKPLPNLDYKIVCGNSLLSYPYEPAGLEKIEELKNKFFSETNPSRKSKLRKQIDEAIYGLFKSSEKNLGYKVTMDFKINFSEVFHQKGGFDVVIANPPYVRADNPNVKEQRNVIKKLNTYKTLWEKWDLYVAFIEKGFDILTSKGIIEFIISDAYMTSKYAIKSQEYFVNNAVINRINFCSDLKIFDAEVRNIIVEFKKEIDPNHSPLRIRHFEKWENQFVLPSKKQSDMKEDIFKLNVEKREIGDLSNTLTWGEIFYVSVGMVLNADEKIAKGEFIKSNLISNEYDKIHSKRYLEAKWLDKYTIKEIKYLEWGTKRVPKKIRRPTFPELYVPPKIMMGGMTGAIFDDSGLFCNHSVIVSVLWKDLKGVNNRSIEGSIKKDFKIEDIFLFRFQLEKNSSQFNLKYLLAILNSKWAYKFLDSVRRSKVGFYPNDLKKLPIMKISEYQQKPFASLIDKILSLTQSNNYLKNAQKKSQVKNYERQIDLMVYKLYNLTYDEVKIVDPEFQLSKDEYEKYKID